MVTRFLVIDDLGSRTEDLMAAAAPLGDRVTITPVSRIDRLMQNFDAESLAAYDVIAVDADLSADRTASPGSEYEFVGDGERPTTRLQVSTGIGAMLWLRAMQAEPTYRATRISMHGNLRGQTDGALFSFMDITEPHSRFFAPAAYLCFGAELLPATAELPTLTKQLQLVAAAADSNAAVRNNHISQKVRDVSASLEAVLMASVRATGSKGDACMYDWMMLVKMARTDEKRFRRIAAERLGIDIRWRGSADYRRFREVLSRKMWHYLKPLGADEWSSHDEDGALLWALENDKTFWAAADVRHALFTRRLVRDPVP